MLFLPLHSQLTVQCFLLTLISLDVLPSKSNRPGLRHRHETSRHESLDTSLCLILSAQFHTRKDSVPPFDSAALQPPSACVSALGISACARALGIKSAYCVFFPGIGRSPILSRMASQSVSSKLAQPVRNFFLSCTLHTWDPSRKSIPRSTILQQR